MPNRNLQSIQRDLNKLSAKVEKMEFATSTTKAPAPKNERKIVAELESKMVIARFTTLFGRQLKKYIKHPTKEAFAIINETANSIKYAGGVKPAIPAVPKVEKVKAVKAPKAVKVKAPKAPKKPATPKKPVAKKVEKVMPKKAAPKKTAKKATPKKAAKKTPVTAK
jgi:hypothetical protein